MHINNREIKIVQYSIEKNWLSELPNKHWLCLIVNHDKPKRYVIEVISKILNNDVCYICSIGDSSEFTNDLADEEITFREVDISDYHLPKHQIETTWHTDFEEGIEFGIFTAVNDEVEIKNIIILDMTEGEEMERIENALLQLKNKGI